MSERVLSHLWPKASRSRFSTIDAGRGGAANEVSNTIWWSLIRPGTELLRPSVPEIEIVRLTDEGLSAPGLEKGI
ncbi:hypothetical protein, partial [Agrobacterium pusense]|uniref:hypothetical protein n=1 Tax=Agrobacterium pusense TaxID=648995 RepID=UPI002FDE12DF